MRPGDKVRRAFFIFLVKVFVSLDYCCTFVHHLKETTMKQKEIEQTAFELLKTMLYIMQKNETDITMNMPENIEYKKAIKFIRKHEKV